MPFDPTREGQLSEDKLKAGYWWVTHRIVIRKIGTTIFGLIAFSLAAYATYGFVDWFFITGVAERAGTAQLTQNLTDYTYFREKNAPQALVVATPSSLAISSERQDAFATVTNANRGWWAEFDYHFTVPGATTDIHHGYVLPGETQYLSELGAKAAKTATPVLEITNLEWRRVDTHIITPDYATWSSLRLNFSVISPHFIPAAPTDTLKISRAVFTLKNESAFSYWNVGLFVVLKSGSSVVGVQMVTVSQVRAGDARVVEATWVDDLASVDKVEVHPMVNIFDDRVYIPPGR